MIAGRFYLSETGRARLAAEVQRMRRQLAERREQRRTAEILAQIIKAVKS